MINCPDVVNMTGKKNMIMRVMRVMENINNL
jgi:hypothetical protein